MPDPAPPRKARICGGRHWYRRRSKSEPGLLEPRPKAGGGSTAGGPVLWNNLRAMRRTVHPDRDHNEQAMLEVV